MGRDLANLAWARAIVDALVSGGVGHFCVSPGSRSAPLALAVSERRDVSTSVHVDERSAGFFALGYARGAGRAAALVCTSGTAAANYLPAAIEAHYSRVPLLLLTADRPPEARDSGTWQTIDQVKLYGPYARWSVDMAVPDEGGEALRYAHDVARRAVARALGRPPGPVHLNVPFREPLVPADYAPARAREGAAAAGEAAPRATALADPALAEALADRIAAEPRGLLVAGAGPTPPGYADAVARLAGLAGYPILAEPAGGLRYGPHDASLVLACYDAYLRVPEWAEAHVPRLVLRLGASPVWKHVTAWLARHPEAVQIVVDPYDTNDDPTRLANLRLPVDPLPLVRDLADRLAARRSASARRSGAGEESGPWTSAWREAERHARAALESVAGDPAAIPRTVAWVYGVLAAHLPEDALLFAANSMAVRDVDTFLGPRSACLRVIANRGAAGIDGTVSTGLGAALGSGRPTVLATGDLAFAHDVGGLASARVPGLAVRVVVLQDRGGGIFRYLPVAGLPPDAYERFFATPSGLDVEAACAAYAVPFERAEAPGALAAALADLDRPGVRVLEVPIDPAANTELHRRYWHAVARALSQDAP